jgi:hypothetical protein
MISPYLDGRNWRDLPNALIPKPEKTVIIGSVDKVQLLQAVGAADIHSLGFVALERDGDRLLVMEAQDERGQMGKALVQISWAISGAFSVVASCQNMSDLAKLNNGRLLKLQEGSTPLGRRVLFIKQGSFSHYVLPRRPSAAVPFTAASGVQVDDATIAAAVAVRQDPLSILPLDGKTPEGKPS